ncbi:CaiF/GrlA family transcriptional regulator [Enterobacter asburiae]|uniref:CaiF/GrlA family transcriptional regulator n=1 Tax=Enterobacter asburiae TaxID=61645 RepID=UPI003BC841AF
MFEETSQSSQDVKSASPGTPGARPGEHCARGGSAPGTVVPGRQTNHGSWTLPANLAGAAFPSLWLAVASWALCAGRPVTREDVAQAFCISARRAADVITYLVDSRADVVTCEREVVRVGSGHRVGLLRVTAVACPLPAPVKASKKTRTPPETRARDAAGLAAARALFLGQRAAHRTG